MVVFMVSWLLFVLAENNYLLQAESKKDCCLNVGKDMSCPHEKPHCAHRQCDANICQSNLGLTAITPLPLKVSIPLLKRAFVYIYINRNLSDYSANFWHPPQV